MVECRNSQLAPGARHQRAAQVALARLAHALSVIPIAMGALLFAGLLITEPWAGLLLLVLAGFLAWLLALSWPALVPSSRWIRLLVVAAIVVAAFWRFTGSA